MNCPYLLPFGLLLAIVGAHYPTQTERLRIVYELSLNRCIEHSCHVETATRSEVEVSLEEEEPSFLSGYSPVEVHAGRLAYQLRFNLSQVSKKNRVDRSLTIGFSGRMGTLTGKQLTWSEKSFTDKTWSAFKTASVSGAAYSEDNESVTPTLTVLDVKTSAGDDTVYVGILDDAREEVWHGNINAVERRLVMPAFQKNGADWQSISSFSPLQMKWTVAFDGKKLGEIETRANTSEGSADQISSDTSRAKQIIVTPNANIPTVGEPSQKFTGVSSLEGLKAVRRPLVVVSEPYYRDPDGWKRVRLPNEIAAFVRAGFRSQFPHVDRCEKEAIAEHNWKYPDSAITLPVAYASNKNSYLVGVSLKAGDCGWGGRPDDPLDPWVYQWFLVGSGGSVRRIGGFEELLDAGDYANDGSSEIIFFSTRSEHSDSYDLLYDNVSKRVTIEIGYR